MKTTILSKLHEIESTHNVRILLAVESGSRAWGFASPDSDYDVRFVYARPEEDYLRLDEPRDVIELPIDDVLDINGWDLRKTLRLIYKGNPTIFEWLNSPIVYIDTDYADKLRGTVKEYFFRKGALYHYVSMAEGNYREYLKGDMVRAKKYFYVLRPVLACRWILDRGTAPPMPFKDLVEAELPDELRGTVADLLDLKMNSPEVRMIPRVGVLNDYLDRSIPEIKEMISQLDDETHPGWERLNELFLEGIRG
ncbi:MAG: nucleotidyltransferase domain-containing protein [Firmicutes bacterium]|nr:nucleotidyltransferase domain-containing protein [Bacillota bacterium]